MDKYQSWKAKVFHFGTEQLCQRAIHEWLRGDFWKILTFWQNSDCFRTPLQQKVRIRTQKENSDQSGSSANSQSIPLLITILDNLLNISQGEASKSSMFENILHWKVASFHECKSFTFCIMSQQPGQWLGETNFGVSSLIFLSSCHFIIFCLFGIWNK